MAARCGLPELEVNEFKMSFISKKKKEGKNHKCHHITLVKNFEGK